MNLPCYLVRDLLPLYKDKVCSSETAAAVQCHLDECPGCTAALEDLNAAEGNGALQSEVAAALAPAQASEAAGLKRVKRRLLWQKLAAALVACAVLCAAALGVRRIMLNTFVTMEPEGLITVTETAHYTDKDGGYHLTTPDDPLAQFTWLEASFASREGAPCRTQAVRLTLVEDGVEREIVAFSFSVSLWQKYTLRANGSVAHISSERIIMGSQDLTRAYYCPGPDFEVLQQIATETARLTPDQLPAGAQLVWER